MARFDVHRLPSSEFVLNCQSDLLDELPTRFVVPLVPPSQSPMMVQQLNPTLTIGGDQYVMLTQYGASIATRTLGSPVANLSSFEFQIQRAIDTLTSD